ncbi:MAG: DUF2470 domain-containing protein [Pseudomonadota bacterium]
MSESGEKTLFQPVDEPARRDASTLLRTSRFGALAILTRDGAPDVFRVGLATDIDGAPIFPTSALSGRDDALGADRPISLMVGEVGKGDPLAHARLTVLGRLVRCEGDDHTRVRDRYLARHPKAALYIDFKDFSLWRLVVETGSYIAGFGRAYRMVGSDLSVQVDEDADWGPRETGAREHMNDDHADAVALYARAFTAAPDGPWRLTGIDPAGIDIALGDDHRRIWFDQELTSPADMHRALVEMVGQARDALTKSSAATDGGP